MRVFHKSWLLDTASWVFVEYSSTLQTALFWLVFLRASIKAMLAFRPFLRHLVILCLAFFNYVHSDLHSQLLLRFCKFWHFRSFIATQSRFPTHLWLGNVIFDGLISGSPWVSSWSRVIEWGFVLLNLVSLLLRVFHCILLFEYFCLIN